MKRDRCNGDRNFIYLALSNVIDNNLNYNLINNIEILINYRINYSKDVTRIH